MIELAPILTDHAVLQQGKSAVVWGKTDGDAVEAVLYDGPGNVISSVSGRISKDGSFLADLEPQDAGGPYRLAVRQMTGDGRVSDEKILNDVWFGEVFLAGGQSNMELSLENSRNGKDEVKVSDDPFVRFYSVPKIAYVGEELYEMEKNSSWVTCGPETSYYQSAIAYYFARDLAAKLGRMIGIINCNWGGTSATCWISRDTLKAHRELLPYLEAYEKATAGQDEAQYLRELEEYREYDIEFNRKMAEYYRTAENPNWNDALKVCGECRYPGPMGPRTWCRPNGLYESMLSRVAPYTLAAVLFYQGEEDDNRPFTYRTLLPVLIGQFRSDFEDDKLPFLLVQLPGYNGEEEKDLMNWPILREIQQDTADSDENCALAVTIDLGDRTNVHPLDKKPVALRLSLKAQYLLYGLITVDESSGPVYAGTEFKKGCAEIYFDNASDGLMVKTPAEWNAYDPEETGKGSFSAVTSCDSVAAKELLHMITGFELAGADKKYHAASVTDVKGGVITLESPEVPEPEYARYLWRNYEHVTLYGANGIPAAPFRSGRDDGAAALGSRQGKILE